MPERDIIYFLMAGWLFYLGIIGWLVRRDYVRTDALRRISVELALNTWHVGHVEAFLVQVGPLGERGMKYGIRKGPDLPDDI